MLSPYNVNFAVTGMRDGEFVFFIVNYNLKAAVDERKYLGSNGCSVSRELFVIQKDIVNDIRATYK